MRALTVKQPWASLIASGIKQVENRTYPVPRTVRGQRVAIHAGKGFDADWSQSYPCMCGKQNAMSADLVTRPRMMSGGNITEAFCDPCLYVERHLSRQRSYNTLEDSGRILCTARIVGQIHPEIEFEFFGAAPDSNARDCPKCANVVHWGIEPVCAHCDGTRSKYWHDLNADFYENQDGVYGWILADIELVDDPRIHRGMLGFWEVKP